MADPPEVNVTNLLKAWAEGDRDAFDQVFTLLYRELRRLAASNLRRVRPNHTLRPTALIHEAFIKLVDPPAMNWQNRARFFGLAATVMRNVLVDYERKRRATKRGGGQEAMELEDTLRNSTEQNIDIIKLHEALVRFEKIDPTKSRIIELRFFSGLTVEETAEVLGVSPKTVKRHWQMARAWLQTELN
jgi:RNA polymerase sigma factor (TIGR02999 family)